MQDGDAGSFDDDDAGGGRKARATVAAYSLSSEEAVFAH